MKRCGRDQWVVYRFCPGRMSHRILTATAMLMLMSVHDRVVDPRSRPLCIFSADIMHIDN